MYSMYSLLYMLINNPSKYGFHPSSNAIAKSSHQNKHKPTLKKAA